MSPIIRSGYSPRRNKDSYQRATARKHVIGLALLNPHAVCPLCHEPLHNGGPLEADHTVPVSAGGMDTIDNLRAVHRACNRKRGAG